MNLCQLLQLKIAIDEFINGGATLQRGEVGDNGRERGRSYFSELV